MFLRFHQNVRLDVLIKKSVPGFIIDCTTHSHDDGIKIAYYDLSIINLQSINQNNTTFDKSFKPDNVPRKPVKES